MIETVLLKRSPCDLQGSESVLSFFGVPGQAYNLSLTDSGVSQLGS
jgi:hypothetical protein